MTNDAAPSRRSGMRSPRWWVGWLLVLAVGLSFALVPIPYTVFSPRAPEPVESMLRVEGDRRPPSGQLLAASVGYRQATPALALWALLDSARDVTPEPDPAERRPLTWAERSFDDSLLAATAVGLQLAGTDVELQGNGLEVVDVAANRAAAAVLHPGDILLEAGDQRLLLSIDLRAATAGAVDGGVVPVRLLRDGHEQTVEVPFELHDPQRPWLEVTTVSIQAHVALPPGIEITGRADDTLGGSAGMLLALSIIDRFGDEPLLDGRTVGGTGTLDQNGGVHRIDGIAQKVVAAAAAGVDVFLAPAGQYEQALAAAPSGLEVVGVATVAEAVEVLRGGVGR